MSQDSKTPRTIQLYSQECVDLLRQALDKAELDLDPTLTYHDTRLTYNHENDNVSSSSDEEENADSESSSSDENSGEENGEQEAILPRIGETDDTAATSQVSPQHTKPKKRQPQKNQKERHKETLIREMGRPPMLQLPLDDALALNVPSAFLVKQERLYTVSSCKVLLNLAQSLADSQPVIVLLLRSGRFAGGVFSQNKCLLHRACQRYTVRKGQGKAQSSQDGSRRPKSMGAQLRRQGEVNLWNDVKETLQQWKQHLSKSPLILVSCPKTMQKGLWEAAGDLMNRDVGRKIPLNAGQPTFESVCAVYEIMMQAVLDERAVAATTTTEAAEEEAVNKPTTQVNATDNVDDKTTNTEVVVKTFFPLTPLHIFASEGNLEALKELLESDAEACEVLMDHGVGPDYMTPLHYASESSSNDVDPATAAAVVSFLLMEGNANPCTVDKRLRVPYFLASHDKVREAFRRARAGLGEERWNWDDAKVGAALTEEDLASKKEKVAEKRRRQRARQKEKKAREKAEAQAMEQRQKEEEEKRKQAEDAKRIRDGLEPKKSTATNVCDFCQTVCKGKRRNQMFQRLDYRYCSSDCVQKHKRELTAQAALSRLGG